MSYMESQSWLDEANCKKVFLLTDEELENLHESEVHLANIKKVHSVFFPLQGDIESTALAMEICNNCDVKSECLKMSLENSERIGIWGGTSGRTRRRVSRMRNIVKLSKTMEIND